MLFDLESNFYAGVTETGEDTSMHFTPTMLQTELVVRISYTLLHFYSPKWPFEGKF